jgi:hypothetical protein
MSGGNYNEIVAHLEIGLACVFYSNQYVQMYILQVV